MVNNVVKMQRAAPPRSKMDTLLVSIETLANWRIPPFQRPLRVNHRVREIVETIKDAGGVIPGVITLGVIEGKDATMYIVDGQHRTEAFRMSGLPEGIVDVRIMTFPSLSEMASEFVNLNNSLVKMRPDDVLRGLEASTSSLQLIRKRCPFVGYDSIRRGSTSGAVLSMSVVLRAWAGSERDTPVMSTSSAVELAGDMSLVSANQLCDFLAVLMDAWGRDLQYARLWGSLNLIMTMWMWRRLVLDTEMGGKRRWIALRPGQFTSCMHEVSAAGDYSSWLQGRGAGERDRSPCYNRLKAIFSRRLKADAFEGAVKFPQPAWLASS